MKLPFAQIENPKSKIENKKALRLRESQGLGCLVDQTHAGLRPPSVGQAKQQGEA